MHGLGVLGMTYIAAQQPGQSGTDTAGYGPLQELKDVVEHFPLVFVLCCVSGRIMSA